MFGGRLIRILVSALVASCVPASIAAQTNSSAQTKQSRVESRVSTAPQVVTIVHRLNGLKMFRLLARSQEQVEAIASLEGDFKFTDDVHTTIIAGLAMDDGRTIAAWLPDADVEFGPSDFAPLAPSPPEAPSPAPPVAAFPATKAPFSGFPFGGGMFGSPDLTVIAPDGRRLAAEYIGLDGATGLSILRLADGNLNVNNKEDEKAIGEGQSIRVLNPEPAESKPLLRGSLYVRMGTTSGTVLSVRRAPAGGGVARFKVKSPHLSSQSIGGVVVNEAGETLGIVNAVHGPEATILPIVLIRRAARRVLAQRMSVPRAWLGVKGEPITSLNVEQIKNQGWKLEKAASLLDQHRGILLTSIAPGSPAASAALRPGDVILKVNNEDVANDDDFSWMLDQAGPSAQVVFTLARPDRLNEEAVHVELSSLLDPSSAFRWTPGVATTLPLLSQGIETIALKAAVAARLGASSGLLVVYVDPATPAFEAGLQPGDVIESINGKRIEAGVTFPVASTFTSGKTSIEIVRKKQKLVVTVNALYKKQR
jgi:S1-C subfamily serine protease